MATVEGPRGVLGVYIVSSGGERPNQVQWQRPSASLLPLLPEILAGQKLVDAEVIIASLDLAIAEADG
jgi:NADH-quinone oxidoreductase subunit D